MRAIDATACSGPGFEALALDRRDPRRRVGRLRVIRERRPGDRREFLGHQKPALHAWNDSTSPPSAPAKWRQRAPSRSGRNQPASGATAGQSGPIVRRAAAARGTRVNEG